MNPRTQRLCAWTGPAFITLFLIGFGILAGWIQPPSPNASAEEIARMFAGKTNRIRAGMVVAVIGSSLFICWFALISVQLKRIEGRFAPLAYAQLACGAIVVVEFLFPLVFWEAATFRLDRSPESIQVINDMAWFPFIAQAFLATVQGIIIGVAMLSDQRPDPVFPRWGGYFNIWVPMLLIPGNTIVFFKTGPLAWDGLFAWWIVLAGYFVWIVVDTALLLRAISHGEREEQAAVILSAGEPAPDPAPDLAAEVARLNQRLEDLTRRIESPLDTPLDAPAGTVR